MSMEISSPSKLSFLSFHTGCQHIYLESDVIAFSHQLGSHSIQQAGLPAYPGWGVSRQMEKHLHTGQGSI
jgi:hypothetical protein